MDTNLKARNSAGERNAQLHGKKYFAIIASCCFHRFFKHRAKRIRPAPFDREISPHTRVPYRFGAPHVTPNKRSEEKSSPSRPVKWNEEILRQGDLANFFVLATGENLRASQNYVTASARHWHIRAAFESRSHHNSALRALRPREEDSPVGRMALPRGTGLRAELWSHRLR